MQELADRILAGDLRSLARAATLIENRSPRAEELLRLLFPHTGRAAIIGITGAPGAGKSTLVNQLARHARKGGATIGILAVDPSSPFSGGAILGDRIRMQQHHADPGVFIRSMATRGQLGGLASGTLAMSMLLDAAGRDLVLIETVGVGQDEVEVSKVADVTLVVLVPGMGDDVQAIKAGIMEIADIFVLNKSDHPETLRFEQELRAMLAIGPRSSVVPVIKTIATDGSGVEETLTMVRTIRERKHRDLVQLWYERLLEMLRERLISLIPKDLIREQAQLIATRQTDPFEVLDHLTAKIQYPQSGTSFLLHK
ncbi:MAG: methylmalonyl Co-A mutase-associated GTPase MeaB [Bryobacterales bacterium]|nr:methylmalonyl Co-A mutase-associated GTPase MeaB [Bryobacterales bacterium]